MTEGKVYVELDVFSGRPNPSWPLSTSEIRKLVGKLRRLPRGGHRHAGGLGYRGFLIRRADSQRSTDPWLRIANGVVEVRTGRTYLDTQNIEAWLRDQARRKGFGKLIGENSS
jgi:hypothetical protein